MIILGGAVYTTLAYGIIRTTEASIQFPGYYTFHEIWLTVFPLCFVLLLIYRNHLFYRSRYAKLIGVIVFSVFLLTILFWAISSIYMTSYASTIVHSIYFGHLALFLFYFTKYLKRWSRIFSGEEGKQYALRIEQYGWTEDVIHPEINAPKDNDETANRPFYTKTFEKVGNFLIASVFILPTLFAMSATGTGGSIPLYFVQIFMLLIAPFVYYAIAKGVAWYLFIRRLEKEKNVIIYNGVWLV